jgi:hypothetical protein
MSDNAVAIIAVLVIFGGPIAAWIVSRVFAHQERLEMIRRGVMPPPVPPDPWTMKQAMKSAAKYGWPPAGGPVPPGPFAGYTGSPWDPAYQAQRQLRRGIQVAFIGLALLIGLGFIGYRGDGSVQYGPWLLGGLIPMFVGIAQIIGAVMSGAQIPGMRHDAGFFPQPPPSASQETSGVGQGQAPPAPGSYGGWRPGPTPEIEKPASPPDYRS